MLFSFNEVYNINFCQAGICLYNACQRSHLERDLSVQCMPKRQLERDLSVQCMPKKTIRKGFVCTMHAKNAN